MEENTRNADIKSDEIAYNCVIKTIKIVNNEKHLNYSQIFEHINKHHDINTFQYGQVVHVEQLLNNYKSNRYFVFYENKLFESGCGAFSLKYDLTKNITDICGKYPEYMFDDKCDQPFPDNDFFKSSEETCYQEMCGYIRGDDKLIRRLFGGVLDETFTIKIFSDIIEITKNDKKVMHCFDSYTSRMNITIQDIKNQLEQVHYIPRQITGLPVGLPSIQTLVYNSGQWPDYPNNYPEKVDYKKAVENLNTTVLKGIVSYESHYYGMFRESAKKILDERLSKKRNRSLIDYEDVIKCKDWDEAILLYEKAITNQIIENLKSDDHNLNVELIRILRTKK